MSYRITTDIFCDQCLDWTPGVVTHFEVRITAAREIARLRGWTCPKKKSEFLKDLCPICNGKATLKLADGSYAFKD